MGDPRPSSGVVGCVRPTRHFVNEYRVDLDPFKMVRSTRECRWRESGEGDGGSVNRLLRWSNLFASLCLATALLVAAPSSASDQPEGVGAVRDACAATLVNYSKFRTTDKPLQSIPWVKADKLANGITAHLFYYDSHNPWRSSGLRPFHIYAGGTTPGGEQATKILWITPYRGSGKNLTINGVRLDAAGAFRQIFPGAGYYPSIVRVPDAGCWRLSVQTGKLRGGVVVAADPAN
jgi:hypothetical protein